MKEGLKGFTLDRREGTTNNCKISSFSGDCLQVTSLLVSTTYCLFGYCSFGTNISVGNCLAISGFACSLALNSYLKVLFHTSKESCNYMIFWIRIFVLIQLNLIHVNFGKKYVTFIFTLIGTPAVAIG